MTSASRGTRSNATGPSSPRRGVAFTTSVAAASAARSSAARHAGSEAHGVDRARAARGLAHALEQAERLLLERVGQVDPAEAGRGQLAQAAGQILARGGEGGRFAREAQGREGR